MYLKIACVLHAKTWIACLHDQPRLFIQAGVWFRNAEHLTEYLTIACLHAGHLDEAGFVEFHRMFNMQKTLLAFAVVALMLPFSEAASAKQYKWCTDGQGDTPHCYYNTRKQCLASAAGRGADCTINPKILFKRKQAASTVK